MNVTEVNERVRIIHQNRARASDQPAGVVYLWGDVLRAIASGDTDDPEGVARAALKALPT